MSKRAEGTKNLKELTEKEKEMIVQKYYQNDMTITEMTKFFNLTKRTLPELFRSKHIDTHKKNRYTLNEDYFSLVDTERKAYWLGYLYADGFVGNSHYNNLVFSQKKSDGYVIKQFATDISFTGKTRVTQGVGGYKGEQSVVINFSSEKMVRDLKCLKMETKKSLTMSELPNIGEMLLRHFIRGYYDGDGSISRTLRHVNKTGKENYAYKFSMIGTETFLYEIAKFLPVKYHFVQSRTEGMSYLYVWNKEEMPKLYHFLYDEASFFVIRKHKIWLQILGDFGMKVPDEKWDKLFQRC